MVLTAAPALGTSVDTPQAPAASPNDSCPPWLWQLYTVSQDGTLCVWESDTQLDGLILAPSQDKDRTGDGQEDGEAEVIRGKAEAPEDGKRKSVRYKQISKYVCSSCFALLTAV